MKGLTKSLRTLWNENKVFRWAVVIVTVAIVLSLLTYYGSGPPA